VLLELRLIEKGLVKSSRKMKLVVTLVDKPGALEEFTHLIKGAQANIVQIGYDRTSTDLEFGDAEEIREILRNNGYKFEELH